MLQAYDAYSLNALDFLANTAASTTLATPGAIKLTTAGLAVRIEAAGGMPAVLTNYDITVDPFLTRKHITAYTLVALPHSGQTMAVLAVTDPTDLKIRVSGSCSSCCSYYSVAQGERLCYTQQRMSCLHCISTRHGVLIYMFLFLSFFCRVVSLCTIMTLVFVLVYNCYW